MLRTYIFFFLPLLSCDKGYNSGETSKWKRCLGQRVGVGVVLGTLHSLCRCTHLPALPLFKCVYQPRGSENLYIQQLLYLLPGSLSVLGRSSVELKAQLFFFKCLLFIVYLRN